MLKWKVNRLPKPNGLTSVLVVIMNLKKRDIFKDMKIKTKVLTGFLWTLPNPLGIWTAFRLQDQKWVDAIILILIIAGIEFINVQMLIKSQAEEIKG